MERGEEYKALSRGALVNTIGQICRLMRGASLVIFARWLGAGDFGLYFLVWGLTEIVHLTFLLGLHNGALWHASELAAQNRAGEIRRSVLQIFWVGLVLGCLGIVFVYALGPWIAETILKQEQTAHYWLLFSLTTPFFAGSRILVHSLRATLKMQYEVLTFYILEPAVILLAGFGFLLAGWGLTGCILAHLAAQAAGLTLALFFFLRLWPAAQALPARVFWRTLLPYSIYLGGMDVLQIVKQRLDLIILGRFLTLEMVGIYGALSEVGFVIRKIRQIFEAILLPIISRLRALKDPCRLQQQFAVTIRWVLIVALGFYGVLAIVPGPILKIFGAGFAVGAAALLIFAAGEIVHGTLGLMEGDLQMAGKSNIIFMNWALTLVLNFALLWWLVPLHGLIGAASATALTLTTLGCLRVFQVKKLEGFYPFALSQFKPIAACAASLGLCLLLPIPWKLLTVGFYLVFFLGLLKAIGLEPEDQAAWERFKARQRDYRQNQMG